MYELFYHQRRPTMAGWSPLDYAVVIPELERRGLDVGTALELLDAIQTQERPSADD